MPFKFNNNSNFTPVDSIKIISERLLSSNTLKKLYCVHVMDSNSSN